MFDAGKNRPFAGIDADGDDAEIFSDLQGQLLRAAQKAVEHFGAQHRALVIDEGQDDRLFAKKLPQRYGMALFVAKGEIEGNGVSEILVQPNVAQQRRTHAGGLHGSVILKLSLSGLRAEQDQERESEDR